MGRRSGCRRSSRDAAQVDATDRDRSGPSRRAFERRAGSNDGARPPSEVMVTFIDDHREVHGVEPICKVLPIAPSTHHERKTRERDPGRRPQRLVRDREPCVEIERIWKENRSVYGTRKMRARRGRWTSFGETSLRIVRIGCGSPTRRTWRRGRGSSTSPSWWTSSRAGPWAGTCRGRCAADPSQRPRGAISVDPLHRTAVGGWHRAIAGQRR